VGRRIWRTWFVIAVAWSAFWMWLYIISGPTSSQDRLNRTTATALMMALPWIGGWLIYWVVSGRDE
jgi:peptidoglycan/LPS O-acetylase OafA/YrhL